MVKVTAIMTDQGKAWARQGKDKGICPLHQKPMFPIYVGKEMTKGCEDCLATLPGVT